MRACSLLALLGPFRDLYGGGLPGLGGVGGRVHEQLGLHVTVGILLGVQNLAGLDFLAVRLALVPAECDEFTFAVGGHVCVVVLVRPVDGPMPLRPALDLRLGVLGGLPLRVVLVRGVVRVLLGDAVLQ